MISRLIAWFFHLHKWKIIDQRRINIVENNGTLAYKQVQYILQCEKCGNIKSKTIDPW